MPREIFISYSRKDINLVKPIKDEIETSLEVSCWIDLEGIESGSSKFDEVIISGINECSVFLFMLSSNSQSSEFALNELEFARTKNKKVVIVNIDGCAMVDSFRFRYNRMDIIAWNDRAQHDKLMRDLAKWTGHKLKGNTPPPKNIQPKHETPKPSEKRKSKKWYFVSACAALLLIGMAAILLTRQTNNQQTDKFADIDTTNVDTLTNPIPIQNTKQNSKKKNNKENNNIEYKKTQKEKTIEDKTSSSTVSPLTDDDDLVIIPDVNPSFPGGEEKMYEWLSDHVRYPEEARDAGITGKVVAKFNVGKDGSITNIQIIRDIGGGCGDEVKRVIAQMPKWQPGMVGGRPVRSQYLLPVNFILK